MNIKRTDLVRHYGNQEAQLLLRSKARYPLYMSLFLVALGLLVSLPDQVEFLGDEGWYLQPALGPVIGLGIMLIFSFIYISRAMLQLVRVPLAVWLEYVADLVSQSRVPILTSGLFYLYIHTVGVIGFFLSTFLFITTLVFLTRLLTRFWLAMSLLASVLIVLVFRVGIGLWMDNVWLYDQLPRALSDFCNMYL